MQLKLLDGLAHTREGSDPSSLLLPLWFDMTRRRRPDWTRRPAARPEISFPSTDIQTYTVTRQHE